MTRIQHLLAAFMVVTASCAADDAVPGRTAEHRPLVEAGGVKGELVLTQAHPRGEFPLAALASAPSTMFVDLTAIENPTMCGFSVRAALTTRSGVDGAVTEHPLGEVTPYPPDKAGRFVFRLDGEARKVLTAPTSVVLLRIELVPIAADRPLDQGLAVHVAAPSWS